MRDDTPGDEGRGTNGHRPSGMRAQPAHLSEVSEPIDLVAVQADDELINALAAGMSVSSPGIGGYDADDHVAAILAAWRAEVDEEPIPELLDIDTAIAAINSARPRSRARHLAPVAAAAAFVVLAVGGVSVGSYSSEPGDALWGVSRVLYSERAGSIEAAGRVETRIANAKKALTEGQPIVAAQELQQAAADLASVRPEEGQAELTEVQDFLAAKADETPPGTPTDPGQPLQKDRKRRVPQGAAVGPDPSTATKPTEPGPAATTEENPSPATGRDPAGRGPGRDPRTLNAPEETPPPAPSPTKAPATGGGGDEPSGTSPSATPEGSPATTTPAPGQSMGATPEGSADNTEPEAAPTS